MCVCVRGGERLCVRERKKRETRFQGSFCLCGCVSGRLIGSQVIQRRGAISQEFPVFLFTGVLGLTTRAGGRAKKGKRQTPHDDPGPQTWARKKRESYARKRCTLVAFERPPKCWETKHWWFVGGVKMLGNEALVAFGRSKRWETKHWRHIPAFNPPPIPSPNTPALKGVQVV